RRISIAYAVQAVPAFLAPSRHDESHRVIALAGGSRSDAIPMATPMGITIQVPLGAPKKLLSDPYRERSVELQYFADAWGMALYTYDKDGPNKSSCFDECARTWPPLIAPKGAKAFGD